jgi:predicted transcriptional regulator
MSEEEAGGGPTAPQTLRLATAIVSSYLKRNPVPVAEVAKVIRSVHDVIAGLEQSTPADAPAPAGRPAVPVARSVTPDYIVCLEDGRKLKMLKRHLRTAYGLTPAQYRTKWRLSPDYPMVAPNYAKQRSRFAKKIGLGKKVVR